MVKRVQGKMGKRLWGGGGGTEVGTRKCLGSADCLNSRSSGCSRIDLLFTNEEEKCLGL